MIKDNKEMEKVLIKGGWKKRVLVWCSRIPAASFIAFIMLTIGIVLFCSCLYGSLQYFAERFDIPMIEMVIWLLMIVHLLTGAWFLFLASLVTGKTRQQVCDRCYSCNLFGRCWQIGCMVTAYILHFIWLILPAVLLLPLAILTGLTIMCRVFPDCIKLSDIGIPPDIAAQIRPKEIITAIENFDENQIEKFAEDAEKFIFSALDAAENSPMFENILSKIEDYIPNEEETDSFVSNVVEKIDMSKVEYVLQKAEEGLEDVADKINGSLDSIPDFSHELEAVLEKRPNLEEFTNKHVKTLNNIVNKTLHDTAEDIQNAEDAMELNLKETEHITKKGIVSTNNTVYSNIITEIKTTDMNIPGPITGKTVNDPLVLPENKINKDGKESLRNVTDIGADIKSDSDANDKKTDQDIKKDKIRDSTQNTAKNTADFSNKTYENAINITEGIVNDVRKYAFNTTKGATKLVKELTEDARELTEMTRTKVSETAKHTAKQVVEGAQKAAKEAQIAARIAAKEAEIALKKAEDAARAMAEEVDEKTKEIAREAEKKAREAAELAQAAAIVAFRKAQQTLNQAEKATTAFAVGAINFAREAAVKARQYSKVAISGARLAAREARKGAKHLVKFAKHAKKEIVRGYAFFLRVKEELGIVQKGPDVFCSEAKVFVCQEVSRSHFRFCFVFISSIIINLSMVHFLMAMSANWIHTKYEIRATVIQKQEYIDEHFTDKLNEKQKLMFDLTDSGSLVNTAT